MSDDKQPLVLIVEDDQFLQRAYMAAFTKEGFNVAVAGDGEEGLKKVKEQKPDCVILDLMLPKIAGFDVLKSLKADPETSGIPVIIMSNLGQEHDRKKAEEMGVANYLVKANTDLEDAVKAVRESIRGKTGG